METSRLGAPDEPGGPGRTGTTEQYDGPRVTTPTATTDHADANRTAFTILGAISVCHMLNDMLQSLLPAIYPMLKSDFGLDFVQVGLITLTFQLTASLLQPVVGLYTDRRPMPYSLAMGMASTLAGLLLLSVARSFSSLLLAAALVGMGSSVFHPESSRVARMASGGRHGLAQSFFQVGGNVGTAIGPLMAAFIVLPHGQRSIGGFSLIALLAILILWRIGNWYARHGLARLGTRSGTGAPGHRRPGGPPGPAPAGVTTSLRPLDTPRPACNLPSGWTDGVEAKVSIFDRLSALADPTRARLLGVLERHELTVGELCSVLQLPQSTVSRHLKVLADEGWVAVRPDGTRRLYRLIEASLDPASRRLWRLVREQLAGLEIAEQDARRVQAVLALRRTRSQEFFSAAAGEWDRLRGELFGRSAELLPLLALLDDGWTVGDLGCGTGHVAQALAPFVRRVVAVDQSPAMLDAARRRLENVENVEIRAGTLEALPLDDGALDAAVLFLVLHYIAEPGRALAEAARALRPGGRLLVVDMVPHDRAEFRERMGHVWQGFTADELDDWLAAAGFGPCRYTPLPADPGAMGPRLFAATASRAGAGA